MMAVESKRESLRWLGGEAISVGKVSGFSIDEFAARFRQYIPPAFRTLRRDTPELTRLIRAKRSYLCIGLDTDIRKLPKHLLKTEDPVFEFNRQIIEATADLCRL